MKTATPIAIVGTLACSLLAASHAQKKQPELADGLTLAGIGRIDVQQGTLAFVVPLADCQAAYRSVAYDLIVAYGNASPLEQSAIAELQKSVDLALGTLWIGEEEPQVKGSIHPGRASLLPRLCTQAMLHRLRTLLDGYRSRGLIVSAAEQQERERDRQIGALQDALATAEQVSARGAKTPPEASRGIGKGAEVP